MAAVFLPVQASAATIGSDLAQGGAHELFACTWVDCRSDFQAVLPGRETQAPFDGIVRRWRVHAGGSGSVRLRIVRPIPGVGYRAVASSAVERTVEGINTFDTRLSIARGDMLGLDVVNGATGIFAPREGARAGTWWPAVPDGSETLASVSDGVEIALNADIDPDRDRDGFGDLTEDACPTDGARQQAPCPADLGLTELTRAGAPKRVGQFLAWRYRVENRSGSVSDVTLTDRLSRGVRVAGGGLAWAEGLPGGGACSAAATAMTCSLGQLPAGSHVDFTLRALTRRPGWLVNTVMVKGSAPEVNPVDNLLRSPRRVRPRART